MQILVAESDPATRAALTEALERAGASALAAEDGRTALRLARTVPIDAGIIDVALSDLPGLRLAELLRSIARVPLLFVGATESKEIRLQVADAGGWSFLPIPVEPAVVQVTITVFTRRLSLAQSGN
ncbi:MAG: response regulator transcription factor [Candidatus Brocadiae bacterium]|nr:response regulator transcription factor [Candidatus Brocadiia bacterium]